MAEDRRTEDHFLALRPIASAPRDGTLLILWIEPDDTREHPLEDSGYATPTIGFNNYDNDGEDVWKFAGWDWAQDEFVEGRGLPMAWLPFPHRAMPREINIHKPSPEVAARSGWTHQVDWIDQGLPCFQRFNFKDDAEWRADQLRAEGNLSVAVTEISAAEHGSAQDER